MSELITEEQIKFNHAQALVKEAEVSNTSDKEYWSNQAVLWSDLYTKLTKKVLQ